jgi:hypothetical protein
LKKILLLLLVFSSFLSTCEAQIKKTATAVAPADGVDPLHAFQRIEKKFTSFFATGPQKLIMQWTYEENPSRAINVMSFSAQNIAYDVQKTSSLVSPYTAVITMKLIGQSNESCGDIKSSAAGWSTVSGALSAADRAECFTNWPLKKQVTVYEARFDFAFQDDHWVLQQVLDPDTGGKWELFESIMGCGLGPVTQFPDSAAQALNSPWRNLVSQ